MSSKLRKKESGSGGGGQPAHTLQPQHQHQQQNQVVPGGGDNEVRFITPMYDDMTEPLDLSKLCLDDDLFDKDNGDGDDNNIAVAEEEEESFTRGRSRSRSVHAADDQGPDSLLVPPYIPGGHDGNNHGGGGNGGSLKPPIVPVLHNSSASNISDHGTGNNKSLEKMERTGPLQQKEIQALKKV